MNINQYVFLTGLVCIFFFVSGAEAKPVEKAFLNKNSEESQSFVAEDKFFDMMSDLGIGPWHLLLGFIGILMIEVLICWAIPSCLKCCRRKNNLTAEPFLDEQNIESDNYYPENRFEIIEESNEIKRRVPFLRGLPFFM